MGSYTDALINFYFTKTTPDYVLAAFSALAVPPLRGDAPDLPEPVVEAWDPWSIDWRNAGWPKGEGDPYEDEPWRHEWASQGNGFLRWSGSRWELHYRFSEKTDPVTVSDALEWLAPFIEPVSRPQRRQLVGYAHHDYDPCPIIFWVADGQWSWQDMNTEADEVARLEAIRDGTTVRAAPSLVFSDDAPEGRVPTDEELRHLRDLEVAYEEADRALSAKMSWHYPETRPPPTSDEEAYAAIEPLADRVRDAKVALQKAASKFAPPLGRK